MISDDRNLGFNKLKTVNRRMFIFSAAKAVVFFGIVGRLFFHYKLVKIKST